MNEQQVQLKRVTAKMDTIIVNFCRQRVGKTFHMEDLQGAVSRLVPAAPDSPSRILRDLRRRGKVTYHVVSRADSLYAVESVG